MKKKLENILSFSEKKFFENFSKVEIKSHRKLVKKNFISKSCSI